MGSMKINIFILLTFTWVHIYGQSPPEYDSNWDTQNLKLKSIFNNNYNQNDWNISVTRNLNDDFGYTADNVYLENDYLVLRSRLNPSYITGQVYPYPPPLYSGAITSNSFDFLYGYYEIECEIDINGTRTMPAFWLWNYDCGSTNKWSEEIDIFEILGVDYLWSSNIHSHPCNDTFDWNNYIEDRNITDFSTGFHKYGLEWHPNLLIFYVDNIPVRTVKDTRVPSHALNMVAQLGFRGTRYADYPINNNYMKIKSIKVYDLKMDNCGLDAPLVTQSQFDSFQFEVRQNISIGNGVNNITVPNNEKITFRATNDVTIYGEFTCPLYSELNILNTTCY